MSRNKRTLALLDVENLLERGPEGVPGCAYAAAVELAAATAGLTADAHVVMGFGHNPTGVFGARTAWPTAAIRCRRGRDGGELALLGHASDLHTVARSYHTVVIGSGDHEFVPYVDALNSIGIHTMVVSWRSHLNKRLRLAAAEVRLLRTERSTELEVSRAA